MPAFGPEGAGVQGLAHVRAMHAELPISETTIVVVAGSVARADAAQVTIFKSVGLAVEDLILARAVADRL